MPKEHEPTVYSTEHGDLRKAPAPLSPSRSLPPAQQTALLQRSSKGRGGKTVTLVKNLQLSLEDQKQLARHLKQACGSGGTVKDGIIEIQGDHRQSLALALQQLGYKTKLAGG
ncbi:MAG: translation initiation factor [Candidatus Tectimicrobiota bacterium]